jgi:hypothetical protein
MITNLSLRGSRDGAQFLFGRRLPLGHAAISGINRRAPPSSILFSLSHIGKIPILLLFNLIVTDKGRSNTGTRSDTFHKARRLSVVGTNQRPRSFMDYIFLYTDLAPPSTVRQLAGDVLPAGIFIRINNNFFIQRF